MSIDRIVFRKGPHGELEPRLELSGIRDALARAEAGDKVAVVCGPHSFEEMQSYISRLRNYPSVGFSAIGPRGLSLSDMLYSTYYGKIRTLRRIDAFLSSHIMFNDEVLAKRISSNSLIWPDEDLQDALADQYVSSRKKPEGSHREIMDFFRNVDDLKIESPVVLRKFHYGWSAEQIISAGIAISRGVPLVFVTDNSAISDVSSNIIHTPPCPLRDAFSSIEREFNIPVDVVSKNYRLWRASRFRRRGALQIKLDEVVQFSSLAEFTNFLLTAVSEDQNQPDQQAIIPARIMAPVMFREQEGCIGIDHSRVIGVTYDNAVGGVRAMRNLTDDLRKSEILSNAVIGINPCLDRVSSLLDRIQSSASIEESDVVEFGVEFSYLESRILNAQDKLSKDTMEYVLSYTGEGHKLLERFEPWQTYKAEGGGLSDGLGVVNRDIAEASIRLLRSAVEEGLLDKVAAGRVAEIIDSTDVEAPVKRTGLAASTQNLGAAVGRSALNNSKRVSTDVLRGAEAEAKKRLSKTAVDFVQRHAVDLTKLAASSSGRWIAAMIKAITSEM